MAKRRSDRFKVLQRLANQREEHAARALGKARQNLLQQADRLDELDAFRKEYNRQFLDTGAQGMNGSTLQLYRRFMQQLDQAVDQQRGTVGAAEHECEQKKQHWQQRHTTTQIYDKTVARYCEQEQREQQRREQIEADDRPKKPR